MVGAMSDDSQILVPDSFIGVYSDARRRLTATRAVIAERYERAATIITSNLDFAEWGDAFPANKMLGAATVDRLRHGAYRVVLDGASYRAPRTTVGTPKPAVAKTPKSG